MSSLCLTYRFRARTSSRQVVSGLVDAKSSLFAMGFVKRMGFREGVTVEVDWAASFNTLFGLMRPADFDLKEKERFYRTLAVRVSRDANVPKALDGAKEFVTDGRLLSAVAVTRAALDDGKPLHEAMRMGGFSNRETAVINAMSSSAKLGQAFEDLARETALRKNTQTALRSAMSSPKFALGFVYVGLPMYTFFLAPGVQKFLNTLGSNVKVPDWVTSVYGVFGWVNANAAVSLAAWGALGVAVLVLRKSKVWQELLWKVSLFRNIDLKSEHAQIWSTFAIMLRAGMTPNQICEILKPATILEETATSLGIFGRRLNAGTDDRLAIEAAKFPPFVVNGYRGAREAGTLAEGLRQFSDALAEDVAMLTERAANVLQRGSMFLMAMIVLVAVGLFYLPTVVTVTQSL